MKNKLIIIIIVFVIIALGGYYYLQNNIDVSTTRYSQYIIDLCEIEDNFECIGNCQDGFNEDCYYDSTKYDESDLENNVISFLEETKEKCIGVRTIALCGSCANDFELNKEGNLVDVTCEDFYQTIDINNQSCNGCVEKVSAGCC